MKTKKQLMEEIIDDKRKALVHCEFLIDYYEQELRNPVHIGKPEAQQGIQTNKDTINNVSRTIKMYEDYLEKTYGTK